MKIEIEDNKFIVNSDMSFTELALHLPIPALVAKEDIGAVCVECSYRFKDGILYALFHDREAWKTTNRWYSYDISTRHWSRCDSPYVGVRR